MATIPLLLYHSVARSPSPAIAGFSVSPERFARQLDAVVESGRTPLTVSQYAAGLAAGTLPERPLVITFDDGYADFAEHALPELATRSLRCTLYIATGFLEGRPDHRVPRQPPDRMLAWSQLRELAAAGVEIGAHSHSHYQLDTLGAARAREEIVSSKGLLEEELGTEVSTFAYPHGYSSARVRSAVRAAGYRSAAAVKNAFSSEGDDLFALARLTVLSSSDEQRFTGWLQGVSAPQAPPRERVRTMVWRGYRRSRSLVTGRPGTEFGC